MNFIENEGADAHPAEKPLALLLSKVSGAQVLSSTTRLHKTSAWAEQGDESWPSPAGGLRQAIETDTRPL